RLPPDDDSLPAAAPSRPVARDRRVDIQIPAHPAQGVLEYQHNMQIYHGINATMMQSASPARRRALGDFVRARREALMPAALGLPPGARRRTPGLRREEVAQLAGLSVTWYTWLEQGRAISVSPKALSRLAGALRLGRIERAALFDLAGKRDPEPGADPAEAVPPAVL